MEITGEVKEGRIYNENCIDTMGRMQEEFVDMIITSPPYDGLRKYNGYSFDFENIAKEVYRIIKPGGVLVWVVGDQTQGGSESASSFRQAIYLKEVGFNLHDTMIYAKKNFIPLTHNRYEQSFEYMFVFSKGKPKVFNGIREPSKTAGSEYNYSKKGSNITEGGYRRRDEVVKTAETKLHTNIFYYATGSSGTKHPAPFPLALAVDQISTWSNPGELVYDPFMGSGTVAVACNKNDRKWIGSEISKDYCEGANKRIKQSDSLVLFNEIN